MSSQIESFIPTDCAENSLDCFNIVLAYQDQESAIRGLKICEKIAAGLGKTFQLNKVMWKFDLLNLPKMRELANDDAVGADMIIFAMHQDAELPQSVCTWIENALSRASEKPRALVALLSHEVGSFASTGSDYLRQFAASRKLDFFSNIEGEELSSYALPA
jgi:hypothetical protein